MTKQFKTDKICALIASAIVGGIVSYFIKEMTDIDTGLLIVFLYIVCRVGHIEDHLTQTTKPLAKKCDDASCLCDEDEGDDEDCGSGSLT